MASRPCDHAADSRVYWFAMTGVPMVDVGCEGTRLTAASTGGPMNHPRNWITGQLPSVLSSASFA